MSQKPKNKIQIKYENAINYPVDQDRDYTVSDLLQNHSLQFRTQPKQFW